MEPICKSCGLFSRKQQACFRRFGCSKGPQYRMEKRKRVENKVSLTILTCTAVYPQPRPCQETGTCESWRDINGHDREWHRRNQV